MKKRFTAGEPLLEDEEFGFGTGLGGGGSGGQPTGATIGIEPVTGPGMVQPTDGPRQIALVAQASRPAG